MPRTSGMKMIKKAKLQKRTNRKQNFKKFFETGCIDKQLFLNACKNDENLLIYTCLKPAELDEYLEKLKEFETIDEKMEYLVNNQPFMNENLERFERCVESIATYLKGYIEYNGYRMANSSGDNNDWTSEFWAKFCKICQFYRTRWFFPDSLKKKSTVVYNKIQYKEFVYICRLSITGERKHLAFLATMDENSSMFKMSLDSKIDSEHGNDKTLADILPAQQDGEYMSSLSNVNNILQKALSFCDKYNDAKNYKEKIADFYSKQDPVGFDKKTVMLGKIFLYKAGLVSPKILQFIKALSSTYKSRYNLSNARILAQIDEFKQYKTFKPKKQSDLTYKELILRKRGEL